MASTSAAASAAAAGSPTANTTANVNMTPGNIVTPSSPDGPAASVKSADVLSHADSVNSQHPSIVSVTAAKARKMRKKVKSKLHHLGHHKHGDHHNNSDEHDDDDDDNEDDDGDDLNNEDDDDAPLAVVRDRSKSNSSTATTGNSNKAKYNARTAAQEYAERHRIDPVTGEYTDSDDDDDANIIILPSGKKTVVSAAAGPGYNGKSSAPGTPASVRALKSPPGTRDTISTTGSRHRASSSISLPASQSDWRRRAEFHNLFEGKVEEEEHLVSDYTCAWAKDILRHGRMYVGARNLAFICTIIGLKCSVVLPYEDITKIEKTVTARVIPNAISVTTAPGEQYMFSSFVYRDTSYELIMDCWRSMNPNGYADFMATQEHHEEEVIEAQEEKGDTTISEEKFPSETANHATEHKAHPATECSGHHFAETVLDVRFPSEPEKIFDLLYRNHEFQKTINDDLKLTDFHAGTWEAIPGSSAGYSKRSYSYVKPLHGSVGPSSAKCLIVDEELAKDAEKAFEVLSITKTPDVPSGGSFSVHTKTCITWAGGSKGGCRMLVTTECVWTGRSMIKGVINSSSIAGQREYNKEVARLIRKEIHARPQEFGSMDTNAPEADDELAPTTVDKGPVTTLEGTDSSAAADSGRPSGPFRSLVATIQKNEGASALLLVSNIALLIFFVVVLSTSGWPGRTLHVSKSVLSTEQEILALERLARMETAWKGFNQCVENLVKDAA